VRAILGPGDIDGQPTATRLHGGGGEANGLTKGWLWAS
jgi:hypothetical protein